MRRIKLACLGCGARAQTYMRLASLRPDRFEIVAGAAPTLENVEKIRQISNNSAFRGFPDARAMLACGKIADVLIIATPDRLHHANCLEALAVGYDVLLEKPIATTPAEVMDVVRAGRESRRRVMLCFVLRFAAFYRKAREIVRSGEIGDIISIGASEGVGPWHQAHSFVRGHWAVAGQSSPMILSKCSHDMDIMHWLVGGRCRHVASFGSLGHFRRENAPQGAPERCVYGCPSAQSCPYNALRYAGDMRDPWLGMVYDRAREASAKEITQWLEKSPWGRCVYHCGNDVVDRQVLAMEFDGGITGTFTMTAFENGRHLEICGTRGVLKGGETYRKHFGAHLIVFPHESAPIPYELTTPEGGGYELHGGGDEGLIDALYDEMIRPEGEEPEAGLESAAHSHMIAFAAEEARLSGARINIGDFEAHYANPRPED